ncbi:alpha/beta hydrolase [Nodosilinea sp. LEGE 07088]|uniref:alpha/beta fold hydrolase n=1 Tax=Nodosilinea sp. LEGE 07088 TaxID=2777968 RepID=UPI001880B5BA|nr:alpha/beta hydrolase [Nodosilinea sp. LEGE 07088]MBE9140309.1 alpha/beta hydrolase [Nodosilinea sp. LEGE 07088]
MARTVERARTASPRQSQLGGTVQTYGWQWRGQSLTVTYETVSGGEPVLLLPAFSTVSNRAELKDLAAGLMPHFQVTALDWPGFGESDRLPLDYGPALYTQFLQDFVAAIFEMPVTVVAAGHAAGYALNLANQTENCRKLVLVAPTWRGPLAVMGVPSAVRSGVKELVRTPLLGQALYGLNTQPAFLKWMYRRHVFVDEQRLTPDYIQQRHESTQQPGARYAPAAFVTGGLDPVQSREAFLQSIGALSCPVMVVVAEQAPPASKAEMEAMVALPMVQSTRLPGTLGQAEEYGEAVAETIRPFLGSVAL